MAGELKIAFDAMLQAGTVSFDKFIEILNDQGSDVDAWKRCYDSERLPKRMTKSTLAIQNSNLEKEVRLLRAKAYVEGYEKDKRTLSSFKVERNESGHTILSPQTRLAEIILLNSTSDLKLSSPPTDYIEHLEDEVAKLKDINQQMADEIDSLKMTNNMLYRSYHNLHVHAYASQVSNQNKAEIIERLEENNLNLVAENNDLKTVVRSLARRLNLEVEESDDETDSNYHSATEDNDTNTDSESDSDNDLVQDENDLNEAYEAFQAELRNRNAMFDAEISDPEESDDEYLYFGPNYSDPE
uniref:Non-structural protein 3 n=1 Tax=Ruddy turnstone rotavirus TaxID=2212774 RepID=A0A3G1RPG7_9REOV|nr:MAG: non-structural protein 3 [Ruddy turnstone rotavirus]